MNALYQSLLDVLAILGGLFGKSLTSAWIFQHAKVGGMDSDKREELNAAFKKYGVKVLKGVYQIESLSSVLTVKQWAMIALIARGDAKPSDFTENKDAQALIAVMVAAVEKQMHFAKMSVPVKTEKSERKSAKREIAIK